MVKPQTKRVDIDGLLWEAAKQVTPRWGTTTGKINELIHLGLKANAVGWTHATLETINTPLGKKDNKKKDEEYNCTLVNKEKKKKTIFRFKKELIPFSLQEHSDLIAEYWAVKKGSKSQQAFNTLMSGLDSIQRKYNDQKVKEQIQAAIVGGPNGPWANITLQNLERFNPRKKEDELPSKHPSGDLFIYQPEID